MKRFLSYLVVAALAAAGGWYAARQNAPTPSQASGLQGRQILYYQSSMHPWIKSDKPGKCTICGMDLVPVYAGEAGFQSDPDIVELQRNSISVVGIETQPVQFGNLQRSLRVTGTLEDDDTRHRVISSYVDGRIEKLFVNYVGAQVKKGEPLLQLYSPELLSAQKEYLLMLKNSPANSLTNARQRLLRLGLTDAQIDQLQKQPEEWRSEVLAPMSGAVISRSVYEGQYVKAGDPLFEIADFSTMWFLFDAYEQDLPMLQPGETVEVTTPANPGRVFKAPITFIDPNFNELTRSTKVRVEVPNPLLQEKDGVEKRELAHRVSAEGLVRASIPDVLLAPRSAILRTGSRDVVFVDRGEGAFQLRQVKLGRRGDDSWEILEGLSEGDRVVTQGNLLLDAQAQLQREANPGPAVPRSTETIHVPMQLGDVSPDALDNLVKSSLEASEALAADNFAAYEKLKPDLEAAAKAASPEIAKLFESVNKEATIEKTREQFQMFSTAVADLVLSHRAGNAGLKDAHVFECPMPLLPGKAKWVQAGKSPRNPFYGAEMLTCGSEVK